MSDAGSLGNSEDHSETASATNSAPASPSASWVVSCLAGLLSADKATRANSEASWRQFALRPHFVSELCDLLSHQTATSAVVPPHLRQLALVLLKNHSRSRWCSTTPDSDKSAARAVALSALSSQDTKVRTAGAMLLASIVSWEWPHVWPDALHELCKCLRPPASAAVVAPSRQGQQGRRAQQGQAQNHENQSQVYGALACLEMVTSAASLGCRGGGSSSSSSATQVTDQHVKGAMELLLSELLRVFVSPCWYTVSARARAVCVFVGCVEWLSARSCKGDEASARLVCEVFGQNLPTWIAAFAASLANTDRNFSDQRVRAAVAEALSVLLLTFPEFVKQYVFQMVPGMWGCLAGICSEYNTRVVCGADMEGDCFASAGDPQQQDDRGGSAAAVVSKLARSMLECMCVVVEKQSFRGSVEGRLAELLRLAMTFMQIPREKSDAWDGGDEDVFVVEEEEQDQQEGGGDTGDARGCGRVLVGLISEAFRDGPQAVWAACESALAEANQAREASDDNWWRLREAALLCLTCVPQERVRDMVSSGEKISALLSGLLALDLSPVVSPSGRSSGSRTVAASLLACRALCCSAHLGGVVSTADIVPFVQCAASVLALRKDVITTVGACKAVSRLCKTIPAGELAPFMPGVLTAIAATLGEMATGDLASLLVSTLADAACVSPEAVAIYEQSLRNALLTVWSKNTADSLLADDVAEAFKSLAQHQRCVPGLIEQLVPAFIAILSDLDQFGGLALSALEVVQHLLSRCESQQGLATLQRVVPLVLGLVLGEKSINDREEVVEVSADCLRRFVARTPSCFARDQSLLKQLVACVVRLLDSATPDGLSRHGSLLACCALDRLRPALSSSGLLGSLLLAAAAKLSSSPGSCPELVIVALAAAASPDADLSLMGAQELIQWLKLLDLRAIAFVMGRWVQMHKDVRRLGHFEVKRSTVALCKILMTGDSSLDDVPVPLSPDGDGSDRGEPLLLAIVRILCQEYAHCDWETTLTDGGEEARRAYHSESSASGGHTSMDEEDSEDSGDDDSDEDDEDEDLEVEDTDVEFVRDLPLFRADLKGLLERLFSVIIAQAHSRSSKSGTQEWWASIVERLDPNDRRSFRLLCSRASKS